MIYIKHNPNDLRYIFIWGDEISQLEKHMNRIPQYMFLPSFSGVPKPEVFLNKFKTKDDRTIYWCFSGLWKEIRDYCVAHSIICAEVPREIIRRDMIPYDQFKIVVARWNLNILPREYQLKAAWTILNYKQSLSQLATRSGKTLIAYIVFRYMLETGAHNILMIVPNTTLVKQGVTDMQEYKEFFSSETVWSEGKLVESSNLTIGTFQSLIKKIEKGKYGKKNAKYDPDFFNKFDVVLVDECHTAKCESIKNILSQEFMKNIKIRFGFSGSLPVDPIDKYACQALLGPCVQDIRSRELMDKGFITPIDITQVRINHPITPLLTKDYIKYGEYLCSNDKKIGGKTVMLPSDQRDFTIKNVKVRPRVMDEMRALYDDNEYMQWLVDMCKAKGSNLLLLEQMLVHHDQRRLEVMDEILGDVDKNCVVFAHHQEYLKFLEKHFKERFPDRPVYLIQGSTSTKKRDEIIKNLLNDKGAILCASYGCVGTGLTLKNLDYGIFAQSFKSHIIVLQALGRGLCLAPGKDRFYLYDIIDCFPTNKLASQGISKAKLYNSEGFPLHIVTK